MTVGRNGLVLALALALAIALVLSGCATLRASEARSTGSLLTEAGFRAEPADTPAKLADLQAMPPLTLVVRPGDRDPVYTYPDPYHCRCVYVGGRAEYSAYERLAAQRDRMRGQRDEVSAWEGWSPWWWR